MAALERSDAKCRAYRVGRFSATLGPFLNEVWSRDDVRGDSHVGENSVFDRPQVVGGCRPGLFRRLSLPGVGSAAASNKPE
jgi:hypothetical protein